MTILPKLPRKITDLEERFVEEYCIDLNTSGAAERVGLSYDQGHRYLKDIDVRRAVEAKLKALERRATSSAVYVRERLVEVVERCMQKEPVTEKVKGADGKVELVPTGEWTFNAQGANKALELLGRTHGVFQDKVLVTVEHELKAMPQAELDARIRRILEEHKAITLEPGADGVFQIPGAGKEVEKIVVPPRDDDDVVSVQ